MADESVKQPPAGSRITRLPTAATEPVKQGKPRGRRPRNVVAFRKPEVVPKPAAGTQDDTQAMLDRMTRDLHAAASIALRMVNLARDDLGLSRL